MTFKNSLVSAIGMAIVTSFGTELAADTVIASSGKLVNGSRYSFQKLMTANSVISQRIQDDRIVNLGHNGKPLNNDMYLALNERPASQLSSEQEMLVKAQAKKLSCVPERYSFSASRELKTAAAEVQTSVSITLSGALFRRLIDAYDAELSGQDFYFSNRNVINNAMLAININPWQQSDTALQGLDIGIYMTESSCAEETGRTNDDRLAGSQTNHSQNV